MVRHFASSYLKLAKLGDLMLDVKKIRKDFPLLREGRIYLDSTATSLTPEPVLGKMLEYYREYRANVGRGIYKASQRATEEFENARSKIASMINAKPNEIIFVRNSSEGLNQVASGLNFKKGDKIVTTIQEHHSNYIIWLRVKNKVGAEIRLVYSDAQGHLDLEEFKDAIDSSTRVVSITHVSNVLGVTTPVKEIAKIAHSNGALVVVDGAQSVPHMKIDVKDLGCDCLAFSGHKMCGPTGAGVLYVREGLQDDLEPLCIGGGTIDDVGLDYYKLKKGPAKFEAGTPAIAEVIGLGEAASYLQKIGISNIMSHEHELISMMLKGIQEIPGVSVHGPLDPAKKTGILSFNLGSLNSHDVAIALDAAAGIMVRSGHHCALPLMKNVLKVENGSVRASVYLYNTADEVSTFLNTLSELSKTML